MRPKAIQIQKVPRKRFFLSINDYVTITDWSDIASHLLQAIYCPGKWLLCMKMFRKMSEVFKKTKGICKKIIIKYNQTFKGNFFYPQTIITISGWSDIASHLLSEKVVIMHENVSKKVRSLQTNQRNV
jgi:hypothetical protein